MLPPEARFPRLDALLRARLENASGRRLFPFTAIGVGALLASAMLIVRLSDGPRAFLDGVVARGVSIQMFFVALPLAFSLAALGKTWPSEASIVALARLRGFSIADIESRLSVVVVQLAVRRALVGVAPLALLAALLSFPDAAAVGKRLVVGLALIVVAIATSLVLALGGVGAARLGGARGRLALACALIVPQCLVVLVPGYPDAATPAGLYETALAKILKAAPK